MMRFRLRALCTAIALVFLVPCSGFAGPQVVKVWPGVAPGSAGGHGFGLRKQGTTSDHWIDAFYDWLAAQGLTRLAGKP